MNVKETFDRLYCLGQDMLMYDAAWETLVANTALPRRSRGRLNREAERTRKVYRELKKQGEAMIATLQDVRYRRLMELRYIMGLPWKEIEHRTGYSHSHTMRLHREAMLQVVQNMRNEEEQP